jgi:hypothetical protein
MADKVVPIVKPDEFDLNQFKSKRGASASVDTLQGALSTYNLKEANDEWRMDMSQRCLVRLQ